MKKNTQTLKSGLRMFPLFPWVRITNINYQHKRLGLGLERGNKVSHSKEALRPNNVSVLG